MNNIIELIRDNILNGLQSGSYFQPLASVAVVFKPSNTTSTIQNQQWNFDLLFLRRQRSVKDQYSGHICFPGGKKQNNQTLLETAIRETFEQTGISLKKQQLISTINRSFLVGSVEKLAFAKVFVFFLSYSPNIHLNPSEMLEYKWVPISYFFIDNKQYFEHIQMKSYYYSLIHPNQMTSKEIKQLKQNYISTFMPAFNIGMSKSLFGFTFYITLFILTKLVYYYSSNKSLNNQYYLNIDKLIRHAQQIKPKFKQSYSQKKKMSQAIIKKYQQARIIEQYSKL